jgi:chaperone required for assembly of F1-ATPase
MSFVIASADFSCYRSEDRTNIYSKLQENWINLSADADNSHTIWLSSVAEDVQETEAVELTKKKFYSCCKPNYRPNVVFKWGQPTGAAC